MREPVKDTARLLHILEGIDNIYEFADRKTFEQVENDKMCFFAIVYQLVVIGEAANMLTKEFRDEHPETPWREIVSMRNFIVHGYNVVDKTEVWSVIENDLGPLKIQIEQYYLLAMTTHRHGLGAWATAKNRSSASQKDVLKG